MGRSKGCSYPKDEIIKMHVEEKMSCGEISAICSTTSGVIKDILKKKGVYNPEYSKIYRSNIEIRRLLEDGKSQAQISRILGFRQETVGNRIRKYNLRDGLIIKKETNNNNEIHINSDRHLCKSCMYRMTGNLKKTYKMNCDYISIAGESRKCNPEDCDKYVKGKSQCKKRRISYGKQLIA